MSSKKVSSGSKKSLILLAAAFVLPVVLAKAALDNDWFNYAATNKGELLQPTLDTSLLFEQRPAKWRVVYVVPEQCDEACRNAIYSIQQVDIALGKESGRANATLIVTADSDAAANKLVAASNRTEIVNAASSSVEKVFAQQGKNSIFLVDTMHNAMLRYGVQADQKQAIMQSRDVLSDLKKMLKLSRIG